MSDSHESLPPAFGLVDPDAEHGLFTIGSVPDGVCRLTLVARTERGYPRRELCAISAATWKHIAAAVQRELLRGMEPEEQGAKAPAFCPGDNALSPLIARELAGSTHWRSRESRARAFCWKTNGTQYRKGFLPCRGRWLC